MLKLLAVVLAVIGGLVVLAIAGMVLMHVGMAAGMGCCQTRVATETEWRSISWTL
ncbi:MAG: hypothetical protein H3C59_10790 [Burkholderiaceae bacterium]|nr:hypothetical protein [Burkholderiaceae bacterium]